MNHSSKYNPVIHHRRSIRLKGYDYSQAGLYFVTICVNFRKCLFGEIVSGEMMLNTAGLMVDKWYLKLQTKFPDILCDVHTVMPNHFHCIVENTGSLLSSATNVAASVGADLCVCPSPLNKNSSLNEKNHPKEGWGEHTGSPLHRIIQWFKTMTTNEYIRNVTNGDWQPFDGKLWQRNYYEHIIRNEASYNIIRNYIISNPSLWLTDKLNPSNHNQS